MCAYLLKKRPRNVKAKHRGFGRVLMRLQESYGIALKWVLEHRRSVLAVLFATIGLNVYLYITVPKLSFLNKIPAVCWALFAQTKVFHSSQ